MELEGNTLEEKAKWLFMITENLEDSINDFEDHHESYPQIFDPVYEMLDKHSRLLDRNANPSAATESEYRNAIADLMSVYIPMHNTFLGERYGFIESTQNKETND